MNNDNLIILLLALIWISNTRYGAQFGDMFSNTIKRLAHPVKRLARTLREKVKR